MDRATPRARAPPERFLRKHTPSRALRCGNPSGGQRHVLARASKNELPSAGAHRFQVHDEPHVLRIGVLRREGVRRELVRLLRAVDEDDDIPRGAVRRKIPQRLEQDTDGQEVVRAPGAFAAESMCALSRTAPFSSARPFRRATTQATSSYTPTKPPRNCAWSTAPRPLRHSSTSASGTRAPPAARRRAPRPARARPRCAARATRGPSRASPPAPRRTPPAPGRAAGSSALLPRMRTRRRALPGASCASAASPGPRRPRRRSSSF